MSIGFIGAVVTISIMMCVYTLMFWANLNKDSAANLVSRTLEAEVKLNDILISLVDAKQFPFILGAIK
jgi:hypothetical protein